MQNRLNKIAIEFNNTYDVIVKRIEFKEKNGFCYNLHALTGNKCTVTNTRRNSKLVEFKKKNCVERNRTMSVVHKVNGSH